MDNEDSKSSSEDTLPESGDALVLDEKLDQTIDEMRMDEKDIDSVAHLKDDDEEEDDGDDDDKTDEDSNKTDEESVDDRLEAESHFKDSSDRKRSSDELDELDDGPEHKRLKEDPDDVGRTEPQRVNKVSPETEEDIDANTSSIKPHLPSAESNPVEAAFVPKKSEHVDSELENMETDPENNETEPEDIEPEPEHIEINREIKHAETTSPKILKSDVIKSSSTHDLSKSEACESPESETEGLSENVKQKSPEIETRDPVESESHELSRSEVRVPSESRLVNIANPANIVTKTPELCNGNVYKTMNGHKTDDDQSTVKSEDSEKENCQLDDMPMDLTTKSSSSSINGPDVVSLSDEDDNSDSKMNGIIFREPLQEEILRRKIIKRFQSELRNEEAKLVLLRKLRQSQHSHQLQEQNPSSSSNKAQSGMHSGGSQPPPLIRGNQQPTNARPAHSQPPQLIRGSQVSQSRNQSQGPPPLVNMSHGSQMMPQMRMHNNVMGPNAPPNLMPGFRPVQNQPPQPPPEPQTPAQRQAAAKLALRKQLEKTLLQIPPPKPPPPEMNFIPGLAMPDFICLLGLEEVVNYIIDADLIAKGEKSPDEKMVCNPFTCCQCSSDFTPVWKREKPGSKNVVCELCVTTNQKKALKQEHTNRLKSAFVKALQQEQEIERMQAQVTNVNVTTTASNPINVTTAPMNLTSASYKPTSDPLRQHQNLIHAHQASLRMGQPLGMQPFGGPRGPFPYQLPFGPKHSEIQRQYLLDMIPNTRGGMPWKT
ncbi:hypothetical protein ScPMuIL_018739 [Solemya velum]